VDITVFTGIVDDDGNTGFSVVGVPIRTRRIVVQGIFDITIGMGRVGVTVDLVGVLFTGGEGDSKEQHQNDKQSFHAIRSFP
jgi:hypothetical protein